MFVKFAVVDVLEKVDKESLQKKSSDNALDIAYDPENYVYFRCRAISADVPNGNGDYFPWDELKKAYKSFVGRGLYLDHNSDSIEKSVGKILHAELVEDDKDKYVECFCAVDRKLHPDIARKVEMHEANSVSMGCIVAEAECSICANVAHNERELCEHMRPGIGIKGQKTADKTAYEINRGLTFTELSIVTVPADPTAKVFEVFAEQEKQADKDQEKYKNMWETTGGSFDACVKSASKWAENPEAYCSWLSHKATGKWPREAKYADVKLAEQFIEPKVDALDTSISIEPISTIPTTFSIVNDTTTTATSGYLVVSQDTATITAASLGTAPVISVKADETMPVDNVILGDGYVLKQSDFEGLMQLFQEDRASGLYVQKLAENLPEAEKVAKYREVLKLEQPVVNSLENKEDSNNSREALRMSKLSVSYQRGKDLTSSFFVGELNGEKVSYAAANLIPLHVQEAIMAKDANVLSPEDIVAQITSKCADVVAFKAWAERRTKLVEAAREAATKEAANKMEEMPAVKPQLSDKTKSEKPKDVMDEGKKAELTKKAKQVDPTLAMNPKELEAKAPMGQPDPAIAADPKEAKDDLKDVKMSAQPSSGKEVTDFFGKLPSKAVGPAEVAFDAKSKLEEENKKLRADLEAATTEKNKIANKETLRTIAEKIHDVVVTLRENELVSEASEKEVTELIAKSFREVEQLEALKTLASKFNRKTAEAKDILEDSSGAIPQIYETTNSDQDLAVTLSAIWNKK